MTIDEMIAVLQAAKAGKQIQSRFRGRAGKWQDADPCWDFLTIEYRVKPEPREWWLNVYDSVPSGYIHTTEESANHWQSVTGSRRECIRVREVLE